MAIHEECGVFGVIGAKSENGEEYCAACLNGVYPVKIPEDNRV